MPHRDFFAALASFAAFVLFCPTTAGATSFTYQTSLSGAAESPANASAGTGSATVVLDTTAHTLEIDVVFSDLTSGTTAAHIHCCVSPLATPSTAGVATPTPTFPGFPSGVTSGSYLQTLDLTQASSWNAAFVTANGSVAGAEAALTQGLADGFAYLNIHSTSYPGGEIRGFLVPEPTTGMLLAASLAAIAAAGRRRTE